MCTSLILPDGRLCDSVGEVRAAVGGDVPIYDGYRLPIEDDCCTCPVDFEALAVRQGWTLRRDDWDPMRYVAEGPASSKSPQAKE